MFSHDAIKRVIAETFIDDVDFHSEIESTNSRALQLARNLGEHDGATLVLADRQTGGRGRGGNRWWSDDGALTFSVLLNSQSVALPITSWPKISLTAGLAVCEAIERRHPSQHPALKWPNDVYLAERKVSGILVESAAARRGFIVLGIGVNVNNSVERAPEELREKAIALCDLVGRDVSEIDLLIGVLQQLKVQLERLAGDDEQLRERWQPRCLLTGKQVCIDQGPRRIEGVCQGIDDDGALLIDTSAGVERCLAGVVTQFESNG